MFSLNPYALAGGGIAVALLVGTGLYMDSRIHHFHTLYDCAEFGNGCPKGAANIPDLQATIRSMTTAQNEQKKTTEANVQKVIQGPKQIETIIKEIRTAPAKPCAPPVYSEEVKNAF